MFITTRDSHAREITVSEVNRGKDDKVRGSNSNNFLPRYRCIRGYSLRD